MSLSGLIRVNTSYTRSVNLERDMDALSVVESYIPTTRALQTLDTMVEAFFLDECPRSWSLVGPYGSGKSSFAIFLAGLLGNPSIASAQVALNKLCETDSALASKYLSLNASSEGYCSVMLTGSPESLARRLVLTLAQSAIDIWKVRSGRSPAIVKKLGVLSEQGNIPSTSEILSHIEELQNELARINYTGLLIVIDELGKFLEYEARHYGENDIYLLQALAEHALSLHDTKLSLVVMLHQAFEQYARGLGKSLRAEWSKVQGRFENIPFLESVEQVLHVVEAAIDHDIRGKDDQRIAANAARIAKVFAKAGALPGTMDEASAADLFARCYPLHPVSVLLLPLLCQKVAQNERTLFSYLGSREVHGFGHGISRLEVVGDWIYPWEIYEYFILNQSAALSDHFTHRRWSEVVEATDRLGDARDDESQLLKAIGLLNIIGAHGNFKSSKDIVELCLPDKSSVNRALKGLTDKSIIQYRKFSSEYRVWQGSDFDLDAAVESEIEKLGRFSIAERLNNRHSLMPIVARKYTINNGTLRYFHPVFMDARIPGKLKNYEGQPRIIFYLAENKEQEDALKERILGSNSDLDIHVLCLNGEQLRETVAEVLALEQIQHTAQELHSDPVAQREYKDRDRVVRAREENLLHSLISEPQYNHWFWKTELISIASKRSLQEELSRILGKVYSKSPIFKNELINRENPSGQANAAKNKLAIAMFENEEREDLGIEKSPPEKSIYRACLRETKLHVLGKDKKWSFQGPRSSKKSDDPYNVYPVWQRIDQFLESTENEAKSLVELNLELIAPPYGIKAGMLPILYLTVLLANQEELAIYEGKVYTPYLTEEQIERFLKRPDEFTVQRFRIARLNQSIHDVYSTALFSDGKQRSILGLAKPMAKMVLKLPDYTQTTKVGLSKRAIAVRNVFKFSKSPIKLMLTDLPKALGVDLDRAATNGDELKKLSTRLMDTMRELQKCLPDLKKEFHKMLAFAFGREEDIELAKLRIAVSGRCQGLYEYTIDRDGLQAFITRAEKDDGTADMWFDGLLGFLGQKAVDKWNDRDRDAAEYRLVQYTRKLSELERLRLHYQDKAIESGDNIDVYLLRSVKKGKLDFDAVVAVDPKQQKIVKSIKDEMYTALEGADDELIVAVLATLVDEVLTERKISKNVKVTPKAKRARKIN